MFDSTTPKKELTTIISRMIENNVSKEEIFSTIKSRYPEFHHDVLARSVASFVSNETKKKNKFPVYLAVLIIVVSILRSLEMFVYTPFYKISIVGRVLALLLYSVYLTLIVGFLRFKLFYFTTAVSLYSLFLVFTISLFFVYPISGMRILHTLDITLTLLFLVMLRKSIFPNINFWGNVTKDVNKNYIF